MSSIPFEIVLSELTRKYEDQYAPVEVLRALSEAAKLEEATLLLRERMKRDIYDLFGKDDDGIMTCTSGRKLLDSARVIKYRTAQTCSVFETNAEVRFTNDAGTINKKRKASTMENIASEDIVTVTYHFSEQIVAPASGTQSAKNIREKGVSVIEAPYKSINLIISISRGAAGLDVQNLLDFQLLTAGASPSQNQVSLQDMQVDEEDGEGSEGSGGKQSESGNSDGEDECEGEGSSVEDGDDEDSNSDSEGGSDEGNDEAHEEQTDREEEPEYDTSDYYSVQVSTEALVELKKWLGFISLAEQQQAEAIAAAAASKKNEKKNKKTKVAKTSAPAVADNESDQSDGASEGQSEMEGAQEGSAYQRDPALADLLQFLLSLPYVDEAWGIHDLILNQELGADEPGEDDDDDEEDDMEEEEEMMCFPCGNEKWR